MIPADRNNFLVWSNAPPNHRCRQNPRAKTDRHSDPGRRPPDPSKSMKASLARIVQYPGPTATFHDTKNFCRRKRTRRMFSWRWLRKLRLALRVRRVIRSGHRRGQRETFWRTARLRRASRGYFATRDEYKRQVPGPHVGRFVQGFRGRPALRRPLQTRSSTSAAEKAPATSAPPRRSWQTWPRLFGLSRAGWPQEKRARNPAAHWNSGEG